MDGVRGGRFPGRVQLGFVTWKNGSCYPSFLHGPSVRVGCYRNWNWNWYVPSRCSYIYVEGFGFI